MFCRKEYRRLGFSDPSNISMKRTEEDLVISVKLFGSNIKNSPVVWKNLSGFLQVKVAQLPIPSRLEPGVLIFHFVGKTISGKISFFRQDIISSAGFIFGEVNFRKRGGVVVRR